MVNLNAPGTQRPRCGEPKPSTRWGHREEQNGPKLGSFREGPGEGRNHACAKGELQQSSKTLLAPHLAMQQTGEANTGCGQ